VITRQFSSAKRLAVAWPIPRLAPVSIRVFRYGEPGGETAKLGLILDDPEEEQNCFSDNTCWARCYDMAGINNLWSDGYRVGQFVRQTSWNIL
jgi:uncharacterized iron-regulated protein